MSEINGFRGKNNKVPIDRIKTKPTKDDPKVDLWTATNMDLDDEGKATLRGGYTYKSTWLSYCFSDGVTCVGVKNGILYRFTPGVWNLTPLANVQSDIKMRYCTAAGRIFFSNGIVIGEIVNGSATLFSMPSVEFKGTMPAGQAIGFFRGRLYSFVDNVLYMSDDTHVGRFDVEKGFKQFPEDGVVIAPTSDGMYVGTAKGIYYGEGSTISKMSFIKVDTERAYDIPIQYLCADQTPGIPIEGRFPIIVAKSGILLGLPQGQLKNLSQDRYEMPDGTTGASFVRNIDGQVHYIVSYR